MTSSVRIEEDLYKILRYIAGVEARKFLKMSLAQLTRILILEALAKPDIARAIISEFAFTSDEARREAYKIMYNRIKKARWMLRKKGYEI
ncbi:MAG: hypothetical protein ACXQTI_03515 [Candidatus Nezhaarchaeales archaeon]